VQKKAASLSHRIVTDLLDGELGFEGLIMTDDLDMGAILNEYTLEETIRGAVGAGNDLVMICHRISSVEEALGLLQQLPPNELDRALRKVAQFKDNLTPPDSFSESAFSHLNSEIWDLRVATLGEERARQRSPEDGKRSPVEIY
jgi:beta-N-acetylhexosaminidase